MYNLVFVLFLVWAVRDIGQSRVAGLKRVHDRRVQVQYYPRLLSEPGAKRCAADMMDDAFEGSR